MNNQVELAKWAHKIISDCELDPEKSKLISFLVNNSDTFDSYFIFEDTKLEFEDVLQLVTIFQNS